MEGNPPLSQVHVASQRLAVFDPYPFSFLTLVVSLEAIFLSQHLGLEIPRDDEVHGLIEKTHVDRLASELDKRLPRNE